MTGPRGARCTGAGEGPPVCTRRFQETRPGAELRGQSLGERRGGAPKGERVPLDARPRPKRVWVATSDRVARPHGTVAPFRRSASPYFFGGKSFVALVCKTRARARRENGSARHLLIRAARDSFSPRAGRRMG